MKILTSIKKNWLILVVLVLAFGLRLPHLNGSFWLDEAAQALESSRPFSQQLDIRPDFQPPLIHFMTHFAMYLSDSEWWLRMVGALIPGIITIWATYQIGHKLFSDRVGIVAALLTATSSFHIFYSKELRPYSLPAMFGLLSWNLLLEWERNRKSKKKLRSFKIFGSKLIIDQTLILLTVCNILGLYSSYLYPFLLLGQITYVVLLNRSKIINLIFSHALTSFAFLPWLPSFLGQLEEGGHVRESLPGWETVVSIPQFKALALTLGKFLYGVLDLDLNLVFGFITLFLLSCILFVYKDIEHKSFLDYIKNIGFIKKKEQHKRFHSLFILIVAFFVPLITAWIISFWVPVLRPKRVLYLLPIFYLLLASTLEFSKRKVFPYILLGVLFVINFYSTSQYYLDSKLQRENWRGLYKMIVTTYPENKSVAVFSHYAPFSPWDWYDRKYNDRNYPTLSTGTLHVDQVGNMRELFKVVPEYRFVLVFDYLRDLSDPEDKIIKEVQAYGYKSENVIYQPNIGFVQVFARGEELISTNK